MRSQIQSFLEDDRAIEGLPIRLVIALVVGVASLAIMMNMLGGLGDVGNNEVDLNYDNDIVTPDTSASTPHKTNVTVTDSESNDEIEEAQLIVTSGTLEVPDGPIVLDPSTTIDVSSGGNVEVNFRSNQETGTIEVQVDPPSDSDYVETTEEITVVNS